jgi:16S rRNA (guanine966-N2)-methyltransferase
MRITGGIYKNRKLTVPSGNAVRPTSDRMRQSLFNMIHHAKWANNFDIENANVLDLFCGSGALGLEALSNGAKHTVFVDTDIISVRHNTEFLDNTEFQIVKQNAAKFIAHKSQFDLVFMDPPYRKGLIEPTLQNLMHQSCLNDRAIIVIECEKELSLDTGLDVLDTRAQGQSTLHIVRYNVAVQ